MLNAGQLDEATRYNMTAIIGLPAEAVEEMAQASWWPGLVSVAPTLVYDHKASHDIETDPNWRSFSSMLMAEWLPGSTRSRCSAHEAAEASKSPAATSQKVHIHPLLPSWLAGVRAPAL
jgi:hypothetical protein